MSYWIEKRIKKLDKIEISAVATPWRICVPKTLDGAELARSFLLLLKKMLVDKENQRK